MVNRARRRRRLLIFFIHPTIHSFIVLFYIVKLYNENLEPLTNHSLFFSFTSRYVSFILLIYTLISHDKCVLNLLDGYTLSSSRCCWWADDGFGKKNKITVWSILLLLCHDLQFTPMFLQHCCGVFLNHICTAKQNQHWIDVETYENKKKEK